LQAENVSAERKTQQFRATAGLGRVVTIVPGRFFGNCSHLRSFQQFGFHNSVDWLTCWERQQPDAPQHRRKPPPRQMPFRQQQPAVTCVFHQSSTRLNQPLLQAGQRPALDVAR
jgi:hypothetical protein